MLLVDDLSVLLSLGMGAVAVLDFIHYCRATVCWERKVPTRLLSVLLPVIPIGPDRPIPPLLAVIFFVYLGVWLYAGRPRNLLVCHPSLPYLPLLKK